MRNFILTNAIVYEEENMIENGFVQVEGRKIKTVDKYNDSSFSTNEVIKLPSNWRVVPGFIDLHIHGANGMDVMDGSGNSLDVICKALPQEGTTSFLATTMTAPHVQIKETLESVKNYLQRPFHDGRAELLGVHLEGPFLSPFQNGAQPNDHIIKPDLALFRKWQQLSGNAIRLVTLAPELEGGDFFIKELASSGVVAAIGHSDATYEQTIVAISNGISHATHLFNGMRGLHHREPGVVGAALLNDSIVAELIVDGIHISPQIVELAFKMKGRDGLILVTDAIRAKGLGNGTYKLADQTVSVYDHKATLSDGTLAGSTLTMNKAIKNMIDYTKCSFEDALFMATVNPAKQLNIFHERGSIKVGKLADIVVLDEQLNVMMTFCQGKLSYKRSLKS